MYDAQSAMRPRALRCDRNGQETSPDACYPPHTRLYGEQTLRALRSFGQPTGFCPMEVYPEVIQALGCIKAAAARANGALGRFSPIALPNGERISPQEITEALVEASLEVASGAWDSQFVVDVLQGGAGTSLHMNANEVIASRANHILLQAHGVAVETTSSLATPIHPNDHVNAGQSTNDVIPTAFRLAALIRNGSLRDALVNLMDAFEQRAEEPIFSSTVQIGRTHLQDAVPITPAQVMLGYAETVSELIGHLDTAAYGISRITLGATAVGTGIDTSPGYDEMVLQELKNILQEQGRHFHITGSGSFLSATNSLAPLAHYSGCLRVIASELIRIANDFRLLASGPAGGIGEYKLSELQAGSTIMPGKVNPVIPELLNQGCYIVVGNDLCVSLAAQNGQLQLNVMGPVTAYKLMESSGVLARCIAKFTELCVESFELNGERIKQNLDASYCGILALKPFIGYDKASRLAKKQVERAQPLDVLLSDEELLAELDITQSPEELRAAIQDLHRLTQGTH